jgi:hypothetical protein
MGEDTVERQELLQINVAFDSILKSKMKPVSFQGLHLDNVFQHPLPSIQWLNLFQRSMPRCQNPIVDQLSSVE